MVGGERGRDGRGRKGEGLGGIGRDGERGRKWREGGGGRVRDGGEMVWCGVE